MEYDQAVCRCKSEVTSLGCLAWSNQQLDTVRCGECGLSICAPIFFFLNKGTEYALADVSRQMRVACQQAANWQPTLSQSSVTSCVRSKTPDLLRSSPYDLRSDLISADGVIIGRISTKAQVWIDLHEQCTPCSKDFAKRRQIAVKQNYCGRS
jgi:hypothetical protein